MSLGRVKDDTDHNAAPVGVNQRVDDWPIRQGKGRQVDFRACRLQKRHVHALKVLDRRIMNLDRIGGCWRGECKRGEQPSDN
jgi:hypothetical protein